MSTRSSVFHAATENLGQSLHVFYEHADGEYQIEIETVASSGYSTTLIPISEALALAIARETKKVGP